MIKKITIEEIKSPERFLEVPLLTKEEVGQAIEKVIRQLELNLARSLQTDLNSLFWEDDF